MARRNNEKKLTVLHRELLNVAVGRINPDNKEYLDNLELIIASSVNPEIALAMLCGVYKEPEIKSGFKDERYISVEVTGFDKLREQVEFDCVYAKRVDIRIPKTGGFNSDILERIPLKDRIKISKMSEDEAKAYYSKLFDEDITELTRYDCYTDQPSSTKTNSDSVSVNYWNEHCK